MGERVRILVTGGAGFIGSNFTRFILEKYPDNEIIVYDKLTYAGNLSNLRDMKKNPRFSFIKGDICDRLKVEKATRKCDVVINFAAESFVDKSIKRADVFIRSNIYGVYTLLEVVKNNKISKFIQISTDEVYGSIENGSSKETDNLNPRNPYSASKASADLIAISYFITHNLPIIL